VFIDGTTEMPVFDTLEELEKQAAKPSHRRSVAPPRPTRAAPKLERTGSMISTIDIAPPEATPSASLEALPTVPGTAAELASEFAPESEQLEDVTPILPPRRITHVGSQLVPFRPFLFRKPRNQISSIPTT